MPGKKLPVLELDDGTKIGQSVSILRFLGKQHGYYPEDPLEAHKCDYLLDCYNDKFIGIALNSALPEKAIKFESPLPFDLPLPKPNQAIPQWIEFLEPYLNDGEFLCGDKLTIADFVIGGFYTNTIINNEAPFGNSKWSELLEKYPKFKNYGEKFAEAN
jgi:glutathione S-transferase